MIQIRDEIAPDIGARERLLDVCFGANRWAKTSERLREGRFPAEDLSLSAEDTHGCLVGTVRLWHVEAGRGCPALLLGPLAVDPSMQGCGLGARLMRVALGQARVLGHAAVLLVGDAPYYARFGFSPARAAGLFMPGPFERARFLGLDLVPGALDGASGILQPAGALVRIPDLAAETVVDGARRQAA
ncbi:GNAT family N-acetyltransferase [Methylobacterium haplocladii]|uniref:GCN5 family N-acetyltransferase n=1 Tax=Methylobacterium haplocladii TaxID=1176176 RepID=A0A512ILV6_9HYPH|nr:N-acetyltransferase [Methylobacterium haplocladii]GEO98700.1 GCN5 family N-acetyltransferase [Methylobacterium haplocladii]GJD85788.1 N-acetyltransferase Eis [Methylobacterium haplocladii]GLS57650.1 GCN5 family N-acetyltransferase [Methylobacterium haplocladii]